MLSKQVDHVAIYAVEQRRRNRSVIFGMAEDMLWRASVELEPYLSIFTVSCGRESRYTSALGLVELAQLERHIKPEGSVKLDRN